MNFSWIDITIVSVFAFFAIRGIIRGFVKEFLSFFLVIGSLIAARFLAGPLVNLLRNMTFYKNTELAIGQKFMSIFAGSVSAEAWLDSVQLHNIPKSLQIFMENFVSTSNKTLGEVAGNFAAAAANLLYTIVAFILIFIVILILGKIIIAIVDKFAKIPVISTFNRLGGFVVGSVIGLVVIVLFVTILYSMNIFLKIDHLSTAINNSFLIRYFYLSFLFG